MRAEEEQEFRKFVTARWHPLVRFGYLITGDHGYAEDLVQTALEKVHRRWSRIERQDAPEIYVRRAMVNQAISWRRKRRLREVTLGPAHDVAGPDAFAAYEVREALWQAMATLPPRTRVVLVLRYLDDLSEQETARVMDCSPGSVKSQASRGLVRLRKALGATSNLIPAHMGTDGRLA